MWAKIGHGLWSDAFVVLKKDKGSESGRSIAEQYRPGKTYAIYIILAVSFLLGLLQLFWFSQILTEVLKFVGIDL